MWILVWQYNELPNFRYIDFENKDPSYVFNRYWVPDMDEAYYAMETYPLDDVDTLYAKLDNYFADKLSTWDEKWIKAIRATDAYRENANNIIDWMFMRNFKNLAFESALRNNTYMKFTSAIQFEEFMKSNAPEFMKKNALEAIRAKSGRDWRFMLWLWFWWLDRSLAGWEYRNMIIALWDLFNFRWAWWRNIFRQASDMLHTTYDIAKYWLLWKVWINDLVNYISKQPEYLNFISQIFDDLLASWKLLRIQDNLNFDPEDDWNYSVMDFAAYLEESMNFVSQTYQWLQSYWTFRLWQSWLESVVKSVDEPDIFTDKWWVGWLLYAISQNFWRNWKVRNYVAKWLAYVPKYWFEWAAEQIKQDWFRLSFGSLRYMYNIDETNSWFSTELIRGKTNIPTIISGESARDWDKDYSFDMTASEVANTLWAYREAVKEWDENAQKVYRRNFNRTMLNASQFWWTLRNTAQFMYDTFWDNAYSKLFWIWEWLSQWKSSPWENSVAREAIKTTEAWREMIWNGRYIPTDPADIKILIDWILKQRDYRPWNDTFNKSMSNFDNFWHMQNSDSSNAWDLRMEMLLDNIKYEKNEDWSYVVDKNWDKVVSED